MVWCLLARPGHVPYRLYHVAQRIRYCVTFLAGWHDGEDCVSPPSSPTQSFPAAEQRFLLSRVFASPCDVQRRSGKVSPNLQSLFFFLLLRFLLLCAISILALGDRETSSSNSRAQAQPGRSSVAYAQQPFLHCPLFSSSSPLQAPTLSHIIKTTPDRKQFHVPKRTILKAHPPCANRKSIFSPTSPTSQPASQPGVSGSRPPTFQQALKFSALEILENEEVDDAQRP
jgi:hypothetical protein